MQNENKTNLILRNMLKEKEREVEILSELVRVKELREQKRIRGIQDINRQISDIKKKLETIIIQICELGQ